MTSTVTGGLKKHQKNLMKKIIMTHDEETMLVLRVRLFHDKHFNY